MHDTLLIIILTKAMSKDLNLAEIEASCMYLYFCCHADAGDTEPHIQA